MASNSSSLVYLPTMGPELSQVISGPASGGKRAAAKQGKPTHQAKATQARSRGVVAKKSINCFLLFRAMMSPVFPNWTQAERSRFIRSMWRFEAFKDTYMLMARVWTFIRDNSEYRDLRQYLAGAGLICGIVSPDVWLTSYNAMLVRGPNGIVDVVQPAPPAPGAIPTPRDIDEVTLLHDLIQNGLPLQRPAQLLAQIGEHQLRVMTVNKKQDFAAHDETLGENGRTVFEFNEQMNYNPIAAFADMLNVNPENSVFDFGVNIINVEDITNFDHSLVVATGPQTHHRFGWDSHTAHQVQPGDGAINPVAVENSVNMYDFNQPNMWTNFNGQMTQTEFDADASNAQDVDMSDFLMATAFEDNLPHTLD